MTTPDRPQSSLVSRLALAEALDRLETMQARDVAVVDQVEQLVQHHGASVRFVNGTNVFRCCGVTGSCTADKGARLLASWQRIAERRLGTHWPKGGVTAVAGAAMRHIERSAAHGYQPSPTGSTVHG